MPKSQENVSGSGLEYQLLRSRRKYLRLTVNREGKLIVSAPMQCSLREIEDFIRRHERWILSRMRMKNAVTLSDGETVPLCGTDYTIRNGRRAALADGCVVLPEEGRTEAFIALLKRLAQTRMQTLLDAISNRYCLRYASMKITSARGRWGSCNSQKKICFSFRTVFLPDELAEYLAVHELCHTVRMNHSPDFWREVERILPDYLSRRKALKGYLWAMNCL